MQVFRDLKESLTNLKTWCEKNICNRKKYLDWSLTFLVICAGVIIPFKTVRFIASHFCEAEPLGWEYAYISESPRARSYHWEASCKMLSNTKYDVILTSGEEAEDSGLSPCKVCMENSIKKEYDLVAIFLMIPCCLFLARCMDKFTKFLQSYTFRNPIVKRN